MGRQKKKQLGNHITEGQWTHSYALCIKDSFGASCMEFTIPAAAQCGSACLLFFFSQMLWWIWQANTIQLTTLMPLLSLVLMDVQFLLIQPKSTFPWHATVTEEISISWQAVRSPVNAFESEQLRQIGMPGRNDGMELHGLCAKCK